MKRLYLWWLTRRALAGKPLTTRQVKLLMERWGLNNSHFERRPQ